MSVCLANKLKVYRPPFSACVKCSQAAGECFAYVIMAFKMTAIVLSIFGVLAALFGFVELMFGGNFSSFIKKRKNEGYFAYVHILWCFFTNSRFAFIYGALAWAFAPILWFVTTMFSLGLLVAQLILERVKARRLAESDNRRARKRAHRRTAFFARVNVPSGNVSEAEEEGSDYTDVGGAENPLPPKVPFEEPRYDPVPPRTTAPEETGSGHPKFIE
nr:hypothetical protein [Phlebiopsis gigantea fusarivirus 1]